MASFWNKVDQKIEAAVSNHQASPQASQPTNMENSAQTGDAKTDDKSNGKEKANSLSVSFSHLQNWGCSVVLLTHISIYWIYSVDMVDLFFFLCYLFPPHRLCIILVFTCHFQLNHSLFFILSNIFLLTDKSTTKYPGGVCVFILFIFQVRTLWDSNVLTFVATGLIKEWVDM